MDRPISLHIDGQNTSYHFMYLVNAISPAGMNFQELRNLIPITTANAPDIPRFTVERKHHYHVDRQRREDVTFTL